MFITVNRVRLIFDVVGAKLVPDGPVMRERPTVVPLQGGPGADHSHDRLQMDVLADVVAAQRGVRNAEATRWFSRADGEGNHFDLRPQLHRITCPVLLMGGTLDPMLPVENQREMAALLPAATTRYEEFDGAGHGLVSDAPERALTLLREFIAAESDS